MTDMIDMARVETIIELSNEFTECTKKILTVHGEDPVLGAILASSYTMAIMHVNDICPGFAQYMIKMLEESK